MSADRSVRCLSALSGASSNRVLNLVAIGAANADNPDFRAAPLFTSKIINGSIILKHRLRADEMDFFHDRRVQATKIIIPFERTDLSAGGQSLFIGQRGFESLLKEVGNYRGLDDMKRDLEVMRLIDGVPSLDPFLLREHLRTYDFEPDGSYFDISAADQQRMYDYAAQEIGRLTALANGKGGSASTSRMVAALLSNEVNEKLEPLRATLNLAPDEFSEGVFSWRGFIYYKWCLEEFWPDLIRALRDIKVIRPNGKFLPDEKIVLEEGKKNILYGARSTSAEIRRIIAAYDKAYDDMIDEKNPKLFRDFLLGAPKLFLEIGEKMGAMQHITSFWRYRFPAGAPKHVDVEELVTIFQDFTKGVAETRLAA
ncbi:MAG: hypothetical protein U1E93_11570 [Alphaproteobacteria bacterium]